VELYLYSPICLFDAYLTLFYSNANRINTLSNKNFRKLHKNELNFLLIIARDLQSRRMRCTGNVARIGAVTDFGRNI
jgi:hypothetical protein